MKFTIRLTRDKLRLIALVNGSPALSDVHSMALSFQTSLHSTFYVPHSLPEVLLQAVGVVIPSGVFGLEVENALVGPDAVSGFGHPVVFVVAVAFV